MRLPRLLAITLLGVAALSGYAGLLYLLRAQLALRGYELPDMVFIALLFGGLGAVYGAFAKVILSRGTNASESVAHREREP